MAGDFETGPNRESMTPSAQPWVVTWRAGVWRNSLARSTTKSLLFDRLFRGFDLNELAPALNNAYLACPATPSPAEQDELRRLLQQTDNPRLRLWLACRDDNAEAIAVGLRKLPDTEYSDFVQRLLTARLVRPARLFAPGRAERFVRAVVNIKFADDNELSEVVKKLAAEDEGKRTCEFVPRLKDQPVRSLRRLQRIVHEYADRLPEAFVRAVAQANRAGRAKALPRLNRSSQSPT
jgi:hypothetical protein